MRHTALPAAQATDDGATTPEKAVPVPNGPAGTDAIESLLPWAENHSAASIRNRAARVRSGLSELTERRATDTAQREAEEGVAKAKAELEAAQAKLREVKTGGRAATPLSPTPVQVSRLKEKETRATTGPTRLLAVRAGAGLPKHVDVFGSFACLWG
ncbi:hypothetical protein [Streptomyces hygroscopicus]|uniref:hypothetical protein n=1 Tax=Streptomyces hygroscopicus TaxID=1912 RepID=UPI000825BE1A|nr:hypothetical protein [Streptomyces hygroscopicus]